MWKRVIALLIGSCMLFSGCTADSEDVIDTSEDVKSADNAEMEYWELRVLNDTDILVYDMYTNEGRGGQVGDVHWTLDIVDPTYYGKVASDVLLQVYQMGSQISLENQINDMKEGAYISGKGTLHDLNLFASTEYTSVADRDWAFCMQNYSIEDTAYNSMFGVSQWGDRWIVFNLLSEIKPDSEYKELDEQVYKEFYRAFNLNTTILTSDTLFNI